MKVVLIAKTLNKGGAASGARNLIAALLAAGVEVIALDGYAELLKGHLRYFRTTERILERVLFDAETHCFKFAPAVFDLRKIYDKYLPDVIQLCDVSGNTINFSDICRVPCPVIHRLSDCWPYSGAHHYPIASSFKWAVANQVLRRSIFNCVDVPYCCVAPSHWLAKQLSFNRIEVILNSVQIPNFSRPKKLSPGILRFGFIAGNVLDSRKGFTQLPILLEALTDFIDCDIELHIFGLVSNKVDFSFKKFTANFHPPFNSSELSKVYNTFDILLCPSSYDNSPNVVTEALAYGLPVIGQTNTGMNSYISDETGALIDFYGSDARAVKEFVYVVERILKLYHKISCNALEYSKANLAPIIIGSKYLSLYKELIRNKVNYSS